MFSMFYRSDVKPWLEADLEGNGFTADQAKRIRSSAVQALSSRDPGAAMEMLAGGTVDADSRMQIINRAFQRARSDPAKAEEWMAMLSSEEERTAAQNILDAR